MKWILGRKCNLKKFYSFRKVSEKITAALSTVKCPNFLNAVQLQGLDLGPIYLVLQWLVKKLIESRDERNIKSKVTANFYYENILGNLVKKEKNNDKSFNDLKDKKNIFNPILENRDVIDDFKEINKKKNEKESSQKVREDNNEHTEKLKKISDHIKIKEKSMDSKYNMLNKGRIFKPLQNYNFEYNDPLRIYFNLIEYGMNKDITFQKNLIELLKKKGLVDETSKEKDSSNL